MFYTKSLETFVHLWKDGKKLVTLTSYDASQAALAEQAGVDLLLVGDTLGMVVQGRESTTGVSLEHIMYHTRMVSRGRKQIPVVADLPYHSYDTPDAAIESSKLLMASGADAVKLEGDPNGVIEAIIDAGIPVMGHLGLLPQTAAEFKVQGKDAEAASVILQQAEHLARIGCFSIVLECIPLGLGKLITEKVGVPTIGIGAGPYTSGQILVFHDLLHLHDRRKAKFVPQHYPKVGDIVRNVIGLYASDVRSGKYPSDQESYH